MFLYAYSLDLGSLVLPAVRHTYFLFYWAVMGSLAAFFLHTGLMRLTTSDPEAPGAGGRTDGDGRWLAMTMAAAFLSSCAVRAFLLRGAALTDDESAYRFMAQVLATGRLAIESHPMKAFFDRIFMINDGRFYGQYFIGWPALMVPGVYLGVTGYMNAVYSALTVPALYMTVRRLAGAPAGRVATLLYLFSPMLLVGAATELSHTSCLMAAAWALYLALRSRDEPSRWWVHAGVAFAFGLGFLIRPLSIIGVGLPILVYWFIGVVRLPAAARRLALLGFALPALAMATLFLAVNLAQNGSPWLLSYVRSQQYMREVNFVNVGWSPSMPSILDYILGNGQFLQSLARTTVGLVRLVFDLFGAPLCLVLVALAWGFTPARVAWWSALSFVVVHFSIGDSGIDTFGPVHFYELALPALVLAGIGYGRLTVWAREWRPARYQAWSSSVAASLILVSAIGFMPVRLQTVNIIASNVNVPLDAATDAGLTRAVIFTPRPWTPQSCINPTRHFVYFRPNNDPGLTNDVLWVNDLGRDQNLALMSYFPGRTGYVMTWESCLPTFKKL
jgi:hypothetical protein